MNDTVIVDFGSVIQNDPDKNHAILNFYTTILYLFSNV